MNISDYIINYSLITIVIVSLIVTLFFIIDRIATKRAIKNCPEFLIDDLDYVEKSIKNARKEIDDCYADLNDETKQAIEDVRNGRNIKRFNSFDEMIKELYDDKIDKVDKEILETVRRWYKKGIISKKRLDWYEQILAPCDDDDDDWEDEDGIQKKGW